MNAREMLDELALRLEDAGKGDFPDSNKLSALNSEQIRLANNLHDAYLTELQATDSAKTLTNGTLALSTLSRRVLRGGQGIKKVRVTGGLWITLIDFMDVKKTENMFLAGSANNPLGYVFENKLNIIPTTTAAVDVFSLRVPSPMFAVYTATGGSQTTITTTDTQLALDGSELSQVADFYNGALIYNDTDKTYFKIKDFAYSAPTYTFTVDDPGAGTAGANGEKFFLLANGFDTLNLAGVTCELNEALHGLVVTLAEAKCWAMNKELERRNAALETAFSEIKTLNARYEAEKPEGIGTDRKGR